MANEDKIIPDGTTDFSGGQNAALDPVAIANNQFFIGVNVSTQKSILRPRWAIIEIPLDFSQTGEYTRVTGLKVSWEEVFLSGKFQAFIPYGIGQDLFTIYIVSGYLFLINNVTLSVVVLNPTDPVNVNANRINWSNAGNYLVIYDWPNNPFILEGIHLFRADPARYEVPVSVLGAYNQNRLCIANAGIDWTAGDPSGSQAAPRAPITFQETLLPSTGYTGDFYQLPTANKINDSITAMGFLQVLDKSTEIGPLLVATNNAIYSYRTDLPRDFWQGGTDGAVFGSCLLYSDGIVSQRAFVNVNGDIIFLSSDGQVRALSMSRNAQQLWGNAPISREVENFLIHIDPTISNIAFTAHFKNKIFISCNPYRIPCTSAEGFPQIDYVSGGVVVLETDTTATISSGSPPVWAGMWTGTQFLDMARNDEILYIAGKQYGRNKFYRFDVEKTFDVIGGKTRYVRSVVVTKEYTNGDMTVLKELHSLDLGLYNMEEKVTLDIAYRPSTVDIYTQWRPPMTFESPVEQCSGFPEFPNGLAKQSIRDLYIGGVPLETCDATNNAFMRFYKGVQLRFVIEGKNWELKYIKMRGRIVPENPLEVFCDKKDVPVPKECFDFWKIPEGDCING